MTKLFKKTNEREDIYDKMHYEANMKIGPTRKEPMDSPLIMYILPDLKPIQKQINKCENRGRRLEQIMGRRAWKHGRF